MSNRQMTILGLVLFGLFALSQSFYIVDERERVILFQLGEVKAVDREPGLHMKLPFVQNISRVERRIMMQDGRSAEFLTSEKKQVKVNYYVMWRVAGVRDFYRATAGQELVAGDRMEPIVNRAMRDEFSRYTLEQVISEKRELLMRDVHEHAGEAVEELGIEIMDVRVKAIDLPDEVGESVYRRMRAERQRVAADFRARGAERGEVIRAEADREATIIRAEAYREAEQVRGEGDARAAAVYAEAYNIDSEFYSFYRSLGLYRDAFTAGDNVMVLEPDGELFRYFNPK